MKKFFLGIDGGGTKTALCLIDENMNIISQAVSGPSSYDTVTLDIIKKHICEALSELKYEGEIVSVFAGLGGVASESDSQIIKEMLSQINEFKDSMIEVENDVANAYYACLGEEDGIVCIMGTGAVAYGVKNGISHRCSGYGYQEGDPGSSYDLGRHALKYYAKVVDKRLPKTSFSDAIGKAINAYTFGDLAHYFVKATRTEIASLAKIVTANSDEANAKKIIDNSVDSMIEIINTVYNVLEFDEAKISIVGSLGNAKTYYRDSLFEKLNPNIKYVEPMYEAYLGSSIKALINYNRSV